MLPHRPGVEMNDPENVMNPELEAFNYSMVESETGGNSLW